MRLDDDASGVLLGGHIGVGFRFENSVYVGVEADVDFIASIRSRLGYAFDDVALYVTGGVGCVDYEYTLTNYTSLRLEGLYYFTEDKIDVEEGRPFDADEEDCLEIDDLWTVRGGVSVRF